MAKVIAFVGWGPVELLSVVLIVGVLIALFSCSLTTSAGLGEGVDNLAIVSLSFNGVSKVAIDEGGCFCSCCCCFISTQNLDQLLAYFRQVFVSASEIKKDYSVRLIYGVAAVS